jgi:DNA-binding XRE family transcriptional regulator
MPIRRYRKDPRTPTERAADESVERLFERGRVLKTAESLEREAIAHVQRRYQARRDTVAALGKELGLLRRAHGLTQEAVAVALGTKKSNISRLESGRYGGLTIEYFMAVIDAFRALDRSRARVRGRERRSVRSGGPSNKALNPPKASRALGLRG